MEKELQKNLAERVKDFLQIDEEHSLFELANLLRQFRNGTHPDKFQNNELKDKAEVRFKDAQSLLTEIEKQLEIEQFNRKPTELVLYKPLYDMLQLQSDLDKVRNELEDTKNELLAEREKNISLEKELQKKKDDSLIAEIQHLQSVYKPSTRKYASLGLAVILTGALGMMVKMENVANILQKYSPFGQQYISTGLFVFLLLFLALMFRKLWESEYIKRKSEEVCSPKCASDFMACLKTKRTSDAPILEFSEVEVFDFISGGWQRLKSVVSFFGFNIFRRETVNRLKDIFIHTSLNKKLIDFSRAEDMQRYFTISSTRSTYELYHDYFLGKARKRAASSTEASEDN
jgi:hypothetical protein